MSTAQAVGIPDRFFMRQSGKKPYGKIWVMLHVSNISKQFGAHQVLDDISLSVPDGSICALIGPNGSGKTTLTKIIAGLLQPTAGTVTIAGADIVRDPITAKAQLGYIPDNPEAWGKMTGRELLHFVGALYGMTPAARAQRIEELLPIFALTDIADRDFEQYSRGNRQKFSILTALLHEPKLLLIDEPIVGLDPESVSILEHLLVDFAAKGGSVLITTHTLLVAEHIADRVGILAHGSLLAADTVDVVRAQAEKGPDASLSQVYHTIVGQSVAETAQSDQS